MRLVRRQGGGLYKRGAKASGQALWGFAKKPENVMMAMKWKPHGVRSRYGSLVFRVLFLSNVTC